MNEGIKKQGNHIQISDKIVLLHTKSSLKVTQRAEEYAADN